MKIIYLLNCSKKNGFGHLTRSILVAEELKKQKFEVFILLVNPNKFFIKFVKHFKTFLLYEKNQKVIAKKINELSESRNFDSLFVDDYDLKQKFYNNLSKNIKKFSISDGNYSDKNINIIFDQSLSLPKKKNITSNKKFIIINKNAFKPKKKEINQKNTYKIGIFLGANCKISKIKNILKAIYKFNISKYSFNFFILGDYSKNLNKLIKKKNISKIKFFKNLNSKIFLNKFYKSDLAIGEGGNAALERYVMQIPSLNFLTNKNQKKILNLRLNKKLFYANKKQFKNSYLYYFSEINLFLRNFKNFKKRSKYNLTYPDKFGAKRIALKTKFFINQSRLHTKRS